VTILQTVEQIAIPKISGTAIWVGKRKDLLRLLLLPETCYGKIYLGPLKANRVFNKEQMHFEETFYAANMRVLCRLFGKGLSVNENRIQQIAIENFENEGRKCERIHYLLILNDKESRLPIQLDPNLLTLIDGNSPLLPENMFPFDKEVARQIFQAQVREISPLFFEIAIFVRAN